VSRCGPAAVVGRGWGVGCFVVVNLSSSSSLAYRTVHWRTLKAAGHLTFLLQGKFDFTDVEFSGESINSRFFSQTIKGFMPFFAEQVCINK